MLESLSVFVNQPLLVLIPVLVFAVIGIATKSAFAWSGMGVWILYGLYELAVQNRILCSKGCDIRVDLIFMFPLLIIVSFVAIAGAAARLIRRGSKSDNQS